MKFVAAEKSPHFHTSVLNCALAFSLFFAEAHAYAQPIPADANEELTEIIISSAPFRTPVEDVPASARVLDSGEIQQRSLSTFQQVIGSVPGLQWAGGTAVPRFFQIRGIGELEQYQGAPNPSVGMIIDDIDYSGIGAIVPLFDIHQVEILKGPQGIRYGSSALAGVINMQSTEPSAEDSGIISFQSGNDALQSGSFAVGGAIPGSGDRAQLRITSSHSHQDGFRDNLFLGRSDTNERDLHTSRARLRLLPTDALTINATVLAVDNNSGFDAFSIDNSLHTQSDKPGADQLESRAGALNVSYALNPSLTLKSITSFARTNIDYSYDGDWGNNNFWAPYTPYDYFSATDRTRRTLTQELRLTNQLNNYQHDRDWRQSGGIFLQKLDESTAIADSADSSVYNTIQSDYRAHTAALYSDIGMPLGNGRSIEAGARFEQRTMRYRDDRPSSFDPDNSMWAGQLALKQDISDKVQSYLQFSRGFKGGGFNPGTRVPSERRMYDPESLWNMELGLKGNAFAHALTFDSALFHALRRNAQLKFAFQDNPSDPLSFTYLTDSVARGESTGLESNVRWKAFERVTLFANGMAMESNYTAAPNEVSNLIGRSYSHAPNWQYAVGAHYQLTDSFFLQSDLSRQASFYFDDSHNQKSTPYSLLNLSAGIRRSNWSWSIWAKNVLDENYPVRGFYFGNEPPDFPNKKYVQRGDPTFFGTTLSFYF